MTAAEETRHPAPANTHVWDGTRNVPAWLEPDRYHWDGDQLVIHHPEGDTHLNPGWIIVQWSDGMVTVGSPTAAERVYGPHGLAGRAEQLAGVLREVLAAFSTTARSPHDGHALGYFAEAPIHPADMARWRAVLDQTQEQPMPDRKRVLIDAPSEMVIHAARHLDATEGRVQIGTTVDTATRSAITQVLRYVSTAHNAPAATAEQERDGAYRERAQLLALLASLHPSVIAPAPDVDEPGWQILYLHIGGRQASWHIAPRDADLFAHVEHVPADDSRARWDGHSTEEKYEHLGQHAARLYAEARGLAETPLARSGEQDLHTGLVVHAYREHGVEKWVFRCWGADDGCDGLLSLDHSSQQGAERARDRHVAEEHAAEEQTHA